ncbi:MAG: flagellar basal body protein FliL [Rhodobacterales bacterium]|nr:MAG: flagellar basal body protein FliL [Rhodobacterales bacterium]
MTEASAPPEETPKKGSKPLIFLSLALAIGCAAGGFAAVKFGLLDGILGAESASEQGQTHAPHSDSGADTSFVEVPPVMVNLPNESGHHILRFAVQLEVEPSAAHDVEDLMPRIVDMMNQYLRAVDVPLLEEQHATLMVRSHLLARIRLIVGDQAVRDVLIQEFLLN